MLFVLFILLGLLLAGAVVFLVFAICTASPGYQDENGFHAGDEPHPKSLEKLAEMQAKDGREGEKYP